MDTAPSSSLVAAAEFTGLMEPGDPSSVTSSMPSPSTSPGLETLYLSTR